MKPSILRNLAFAFIGFGLLMGVVFPLYAQFFVEWKEGMKGWFIIGCLVAGTTIGVVNYWLVNLVLLRKLRRISEVANAISNKDLSFSCSIESHDVVGEIVTSFNRMSQTLRSLVEEVRHTVNALNDAASALASVTDESTQQVQRQQGQTDLVMRSLSEITNRIHDISQSATEAADSARRANDSSATGRRVVSGTVDSITQLAGAIEKASGVIDTLERQSEEIGSVLEVIRGIAEQTNLLALNAAIEAARAGESGRGFAVVADEVRSLASRTQQSTREIQSMIERLQSGSRDAVNVMRDSRTQAQNSVDQAVEAGSTLETIAIAVAGINQMNSKIAGAADEQRNETDVVNQSMSDIAHIAEQSVQSAQQVVAASQQLGHLANDLRQLVSEYRV